MDDKILNFNEQVEKLLKKSEEKEASAEKEELEARLSIIMQYYTATYYNLNILYTEIESLQNKLWDIHYSEPRQLELLL